ncbi:MAG: hypothetical protein IJ189_08240 [Clostridia bacterium]|nr:hypothetical protein [Clostridia bacterium]
MFLRMICILDGPEEKGYSKRLSVFLKNEECAVSRGAACSARHFDDGLLKYKTKKSNAKMLAETP